MYRKLALLVLIIFVVIAFNTQCYTVLLNPDRQRSGEEEYSEYQYHDMYWNYPYFSMGLYSPYYYGLYGSSYYYGSYLGYRYGTFYPSNRLYVTQHNKKRGFSKSGAGVRTRSSRLASANTSGADLKLLINRAAAVKNNNRQRAPKNISSNRSNSRSRANVSGRRASPGSYRSAPRPSIRSSRPSSGGTRSVSRGGSRTVSRRK